MLQPAFIQCCCHRDFQQPKDSELIKLVKLKGATISLSR